MNFLQNYHEIQISQGIIDSYNWENQSQNVGYQLEDLRKVFASL